MPAGDAHRDPSERPEAEPIWPDRPIDRLTRPLERFMHVQAAGGLVLLAATLLALAAANSPLAAWYRGIWEQPLVVRLGDFELAYPLWYWINDGLMAIFFFVIGLEIKRELVWGELQDPRNVVLPAAAAAGGVLAPVTLYLLQQPALPGRAGWAVPMATDIAFVVGCLALLGARVPAGLKIFLLSLAIIDDILAVLVIAIFFTTAIEATWLAGAAVGFGMTGLLNRLGVRRVTVYVLVGVGIWLCTLKSGVHPTVAGALLGLLTPASAWIGRETLLEAMRRAVERLRGTGTGPDAERREAAEDLAFAATESVSPLERLEHGLHPWVGFAIMPLFALANAGVAVSLGGLAHPIAAAVAVGLVAGKPLGIVGASWLVVRLGLAKLPEATSWTALVGAGCLGGIGFTMALFIASLSLTGAGLEAAKSGILAGSAASLVLGLGLLARALPRRAG
ncbi:MAG TPA: Na+/H+ antiporter NhaA [Methylomirabilota bacterium]|nr:Na+/H+ antiporter NhaA [Methylomirabilota bacterium]